MTQTENEPGRVHVVFRALPTADGFSLAVAAAAGDADGAAALAADADEPLLRLKRIYEECAAAAAKAVALPWENVAAFDAQVAAEIRKLKLPKAERDVLLNIDDLRLHETAVLDVAGGVPEDAPAEDAEIHVVLASHVDQDGRVLAQKIVAACLGAAAAAAEAARRQERTAALGAAVEAELEANLPRLPPARRPRRRELFARLAAAADGSPDADIVRTDLAFFDGVVPDGATGRYEVAAAPFVPARTPPAGWSLR